MSKHITKLERLALIDHIMSLSPASRLLLILFGVHLEWQTVSNSASHRHKDNIMLEHINIQ
jgi:hypothetical protein